MEFSKDNGEGKGLLAFIREEEAKLRKKGMTLKEFNALMKKPREPMLFLTGAKGMEYMNNFFKDMFNESNRKRD